MAATLDDIKDELKTQNQMQGESVKETRTLSERLSETKLTEAFRGGLQKFLGLDFVENFKKLGSKMQDVGKSIASKLDSMIVSPVKDLFSGFFDAIKFGIAIIGGVVAMTSFLDGWKKAEDWFGSNANFGEKISSALASVLATFTGLGDEDTKKLAETIVTMVNYVSEKVTAAFDTIAPGIKDLISGIFSGDGALIGSGIRDIVTGVTDFFLDIGTDLLANFIGEEKANAIMQPIKDLVQTLLDLGGDLLGIVTGVFGVLTGEEGAWAGLGASVKSLGKNILSAIDSVITSVLAVFGFDDEFAAFKLTISELWTKTGELVSGIKDSIVGAIKTIANFFYNAETGEVFMINWGQLLIDLTTTVTGTYNFILDKVKSIGKFFYDAETGNVFGINFKQLIIDLAIKVTETANLLPQKIGDMFTTLWDKITSIFENLVNGIIKKVNIIPGVNFKPIDLGSKESPPAAVISSTPNPHYEQVAKDTKINAEMNEEKEAGFFSRMSDKIGSIFNTITNNNNTTNNVINSPTSTVTP